MPELTLFTYFRSSAAYRVRIVLALKAIRHRKKFVHLLRAGGEHRHLDYLALNPQGLTPTLVVDSHVLTQSLAIIEYLDECYPQPPLLPPDPIERAHVRAMAQTIACDVHPLNNLRVLRYLELQFQIAQAERNTWYCHWVEEGFNALEKLLMKSDISNRYCNGDALTMADVCLVPQVYNAYRFNVDMAVFPRIRAVYDRCMELEAFHQAAPEQQEDFAEPNI